jgi:hypothetical protein
MASAPAHTAFEVAFDTSALQELMNREEITARELALLLDGAAIVFVSPVVPAQLLRTRDVGRLRCKEARLTALGGEHFFVTAPLPSLLDTEASTFVHETACYTDLQRWARDFMQLTSEQREEFLAQWLDHPRMRELETRAHARYCATIPKPSPQAVMQEATLHSDFFRHCLQGVSRKADVDLVLAAPSRYAAHVTLTGMVVLNAIGAYASSAVAKDRPWLKAEPDNWNDAAIVANSAYADLLVSEDTNMRSRLQFLRHQGLAFVRPVSLDEFLEHGVRAPDDGCKSPVV